jgi:hypothetical protein
MVLPWTGVDAYWYDARTQALFCLHPAWQECSLLCDDYARLGYDRFLMDPSVRVVSAVRTA